MKQDQLQTFTNKQIGELRGFMKDGEPWFLAGNVCRALGIKNTSDTIKKIKEKRREAGIDGIVSNDTVIIDSKGRRNKATIIPERTVYELIFQSRKKKAYLFQTWVFDEVLPALRKHGKYRMEGKLIRLGFTDSIKDSGENSRMRGFAYSTYTNLIYKSLGAKKGDRDTFSDELLERIAHKENLVAALVKDGKSYDEIKELVL